MPRLQYAGKRLEGLLLFAVVSVAHLAVLLALAPSPGVTPRPRPPVVVELIALPSALPGPQAERSEVRSAAAMPMREPPRSGAPSAHPSKPAVTPSRQSAAETPERLTARASPGPAVDAGADAAAETYARPAPSGPLLDAPERASSARTATAPPADAAITPPRFDAPHLRNAGAEYPRLARRLGEQGRVLLRVLVSRTGVAEKVEVETSSGSPRLDHTAREAVARWQFVPARRGEEPVAAWLLVPVVFRLEG
jgi:protein TonB